MSFSVMPNFKYSDVTFFLLWPAIKRPRNVPCNYYDPRMLYCNNVSAIILLSRWCYYAVINFFECSFNHWSPLMFREINSTDLFFRQELHTVFLSIRLELLSLVSLVKRACTFSIPGLYVSLIFFCTLLIIQHAHWIYKYIFYATLLISAIDIL